ncbi:MAG TPA: hypothetical protein VJ086_04845, partial [Rubrobacteraceae bacterium]|nr:hypothetical protein [Rubrobacteraceae bacterium]
MKTWTTTRESVFSPIKSHKDTFFVLDLVLRTAPQTSSERFLYKNPTGTGSWEERSSTIECGAHDARDNVRSVDEGAQDISPAGILPKPNWPANPCRS